MGLALFYPHTFLKSKGDIVIASIFPLCYLLLNHWKKFNQIWCVSYSHHEWGMQRQILWELCPLGHWGGAKGQISSNFNYKVNFKDFFYQTLCVFSRMKDTKNIRRDFHSVTWVMDQGWGAGGAQVVKKYFSNIVMLHIKSTGLTSRTEC